MSVACGPRAEAWAATRDTTSIAVLEAFIARFPGTACEDFARARLTELRSASTPGSGGAVAATPPPAVQGTDPVRAAAIAGRLSGDGILAGYWIETNSNKRCGKTVQGSYYWGRVVFRFDAARDGWDGSWAYCDEQPCSRSWNGRR